MEPSKTSVRSLSAFLFLLSVAPVYAQLTTTLQPQTVTEFDQYASNVEQQLAERWHGQRPFLSIDGNPSDRQSVLGGDVFIRPGNSDNPVTISKGLIHDWIGTVFIPNTPIQKVLAILQDFDHHSGIYPSILSSRLLRRSGNDLTGYWRVEWKNPLLTVALDIEQQAQYRKVGSGKWICKAYARNISEVDNAGTAREKKLPPGEGAGYLWRMYAYWSLETVNGSVLAECRTLSLSRDVPPSLTWVIKPFLQSLPRQSLAGTLRDTRNAAIK